MSFHSSLRDLVANSDEQNIIWRSLLQALIDQGGTKNHLELLLRDAKGERVLLNKFAREIIGRIWQLCDETVSLGKIDFDCPIENFHHAFETSDAVGLGDKYTFSETKPDGPCGYRLIHFDRPMVVHEVCEADLSCFKRSAEKVIAYAGWRELIVYTSRLQPRDLNLCNIIAPDSEMLVHGGELKPKGNNPLPLIQGTVGYTISPWLVISFMMPAPEAGRHNLSNFYLVRVYS